MAVAQRSGGGYMERPRPSGLADVIDIILDKGLVIDAYVRVSLIGIELLTIDARIVIASVDTYLRFAEAVGRLNIAESGDSVGLPELLEGLTEGGANSIKGQGCGRGRQGEAIGLGESGDEERETPGPAGGGAKAVGARWRQTSTAHEGRPGCTARRRSTSSTGAWTTSTGSASLRSRRPSREPVDDPPADAD